MTRAPLIRSLDLLPGETPASYVSRLAAHHGTPPREFCSDFGMRWPFLCSGQDDQFQTLTRLTGVDLDELRFWAPRKLGNGRYRIGATTSSVGAFRRTTIRLCPICATAALKAQGPSGVFQLLEWCVTCIHRCEVHGAMLCALPAAAHAHETYMSRRLPCATSKFWSRQPAIQKFWMKVRSKPIFASASIEVRGMTGFGPSN